jgi:nucleoside-diphosphate-sugar epimerase
MENKVLVTGASGFLGNEIIASFIQKNQIVHSLGRKNCEYNIALDKAIPSFNESFDVVIHAAGKAHMVPKNQNENDDFYLVNVTGTKNLLKALERSNSVKEFVFISSVSVYGLDKGTEINELTPLLASDPYGRSKILAEKIVEEWCSQNNVVCTILRLPLLVGYAPPGNLGKMINAIENGRYFNIGDKDVFKSMVLVKDVANFLPIVSKIGGIFNLTDGIHPSFKELSKAIAINKRKKVFTIPTIFFYPIAKFGDFFSFIPFNSKIFNKITSSLTFCDQKARDVLGWKPNSVLEFIKNNNI